MNFGVEYGCFPKIGAPFLGGQIPLFLVQHPYPESSWSTLRVMSRIDISDLQDARLKLREIIEKRSADHKDVRDPFWNDNA